MFGRQRTTQPESDASVAIGRASVSRVEPFFAIQRAYGNQAAVRLQRSCGCGGSGGGCACDEKQREKVQRLTAEPNAPYADVPEIAESHGFPIPARVRSRGEFLFGVDFSRVRLHDDARVAGAANRLRAHAFTIGHDVYFARGAFRPTTPEGLSVLGHELIHVVQQRPSAHTDMQAKLKVNIPGDAYEQEADRVAEQLVRIPEQQLPQNVQEHDAGKMTVSTSVQSGTSLSGQPLNPATREFMEQRFGVDFDRVRTHTDGKAARACSSLNAEAFTYRQHIYFGAGKSPGRDRLTAHELTHVVQQTGPHQARIQTGSVSRTKLWQAPGVQRKLELRPPGKGEASAFGRAQELVDRLNTLSLAIQYELEGQELLCTVMDATALTYFDTVMKGFIGRPELVPMRLITSKGYLGGRSVFADDLNRAYVDLDDLLADDLYSFQSDLLHFLTERFDVKDYARRVGTVTKGEFVKGHKAGKEAEAAQLQALFDDPSIVFLYEQSKAGKPWVNAFKSKDHGYRVFQVVHHREREIAGGEMWVQKKDGTRISIEDFRKERAAAPK